MSSRHYPITTKESEDMENKKLICGGTSMQGWRTRQEDAHFAFINFDKNISLFGVFDGHGGGEVAKYAVELLPGIIKYCSAYKNGDYVQALRYAYRVFDEICVTDAGKERLEQLRIECNLRAGIKKSTTFGLAGLHSGSTAVVALLVGNLLYVANVGDSRCVLATGGKKAFAMTTDHLPMNEPEADRIYKAGGHISLDGRLNFDINMSRSFGDYTYKSNRALPANEQMMISVPEIRVKEVFPANGDFIILACDGIWNCMSNQSTLDFIANRLKKNNVKLSKIAEDLCDFCLSPDNLYGGDGLDNMTCFIITFKNDESKPKLV